MGNGRKSTNKALYLSVLAASAIDAGTYCFDGYANAGTSTLELSSPKRNGRDVYSDVKVDVTGGETLPFYFLIHGEGAVNREEYDFGGDDSIEYVIGYLELWLGKKGYSFIYGGFRHGCVLAEIGHSSEPSQQLFSVCLDDLMH